MSIFYKQTDPAPCWSVSSPETMVDAIRACGIIPFFENAIPGYSIEEMTPVEHWFDGDSLGPWDWKIDVVQTGEIAYGKFLCGGKAAFATMDCYRDLLNWRRSLPKFALKDNYVLYDNAVSCCNSNHVVSLCKTISIDSLEVRIYILAHYYAASHVDDSNVLHTFSCNVDD